MYFNRFYPAIVYSMIFTVISACAAKSTTTLPNMSSHFTHTRQSGLTLFELTAKRQNSHEATTLSKQGLKMIKRNSINLMELELENAKLCPDGYILSEQTLSSAFIRLKGECL